MERARTLGANETFNYRNDPNWDAFVLDRTGGVGADLVVESVGGESFVRLVAAVRQGGTVFTIGFLGGTGTQLDLLPVITKEVCIQGSNGGSVADLASAAAAIAAHRIEPVIDRSFAAADLTEAYRFMEKGGHFGKITVRLDW